MSNEINDLTSLVARMAPAIIGTLFEHSGFVPELEEARGLAITLRNQERSDELERLREAYCYCFVGVPRHMPWLPCWTCKVIDGPLDHAASELRRLAWERRRVPK